LGIISNKIISGLYGVHKASTPADPTLPTTTIMPGAKMKTCETCGAVVAQNTWATHRITHQKFVTLKNLAGFPPNFHVHRGEDQNFHCPFPECNFINSNPRTTSKHVNNCRKKPATPSEELLRQSSGVTTSLVDISMPTSV
jgi:hypothetical protein